MSMMKIRLHLTIVATLNIIMTLILYCSLQGTRANGSYIQTLVFDPMGDHLRCVRLEWNNNTANSTCEQIYTESNNVTLCVSVTVFTLSFLLFFWLVGEKLTYYGRPILNMIIDGWYLARLYDAFHISSQVNVLTTYFINWQLVFIYHQWEFRKLPLLSSTIYRASVCMYIVSITLFFYETMFHHVSKYVIMGSFWIFSILDIVLCLHPKGFLSGPRLREEIMKGVLPSAVGLYSTNKLDDDESDEVQDSMHIGLGDLLAYNLMLLCILPPLSSTTTKVWVSIGYIIAVGIGLEGTWYLINFSKGRPTPALPLPVLAVSIYACVLHFFTE